MTRILAMAHRKGMTRARLFSKINVSHEILDSYLYHLVDDGLLELSAVEKNGKSLYKTTDRGKKYLEAYDSRIGLAGGLGMVPLFSDDNLRELLAAGP